MDWLKKNYDKVILLVAALITIWIAITLVLRANSFGDNFILKSVTPKNDPPETLKEDVIVATETLGIPSYWAPPTLPEGAKPALFLSVPIVEKDGQIFNMSQEEPQLRPPFSNRWLIENGLDFLRADVADLDPDRDGFTNEQEWENGKTEPDEADEHPSFLQKLFLVQRDQTDYFVTFKANIQPDFQVEWAPPGVRSETKFKKIGETFADERFKIESFEVKEAEVNGIRKDVSELTVKDLATGQDLVLVLDQGQNLPTYFALFRFDLGDAAEFKVKHGETFKLPSGEDTTYKLIDVQEDKAVIEDVPPAGSGKTPVQVTVPKAGS